MSALLESVLSEIERERRTFEATTKHGDYLIADLRKAFDEIADAANWKNPIEAVIETCDFELYSAAVAFFTGSELVKVGWDVNSTDRIIVRADGYYAVYGA